MQIIINFNLCILKVVKSNLCCFRVSVLRIYLNPATCKKKRKTMRQHRIFYLVIIFAIAFAYIESSVVVYIRELYYPEGFHFPLKLMAFNIIITELFRELATLIILLSIAVIAGRNFGERLAYFILSFALWDIFYYLFLKVLINWPPSLLTWDILFFIPLTWVGPVLAPVINSLTMIVMSLVILYFTRKSKKVRFNFLIWSLIIVGCLITIYGYTEEYTSFMLKEFRFIDLLGAGQPKRMLSYAINFVPVYFNWYIFSLGEMLFFVAIILIFKNSSNPS